MGVPPEMDVHFLSVEQAAADLPSHQGSRHKGIVLTGDIDTMLRLVDASRGIDRVNIGGIHHRQGRTQRLRYVFLTPDEEASLRALASRGVEVTAQDVPAAHRVALDELLAGGHA